MKKKILLSLVIIFIPIYFLYLEQIMFGPNFCTLKLKQYDLEYFTNKVKEIESTKPELQKDTKYGAYSGWDKKVLYTKSRSSFSSLPTHSYIWNYSTKIWWEWLACLSMSTCWNISFSLNSGDCGWLETVLEIK